MSDLKIERDLPAGVETVFAFVTQSKHLLKWWGPEGVEIKEETLDFSEPGPWTSTMINNQGGRFKVSGEVLAVDPPNSVEFTWAWHNEEDQRGDESVVRFLIEPNGNNRSMLTLIQTGLQGGKSRSNHNEGWTSSLRKLERLIA